MWHKSSRHTCLSNSTDFPHPLHVLPLTPAWPCSAPLHPTGLDNSPPPPLLLFPVCIIVTVQLYLSHSAKRTESSGGPAATAVTPRLAADRQQTLASGRGSKVRKGCGTRKTPSFSLQLRNSGSLSSYCSLDTPSYRSPVKSPSQYFQICY